MIIQQPMLLYKELMKDLRVTKPLFQPLQLKEQHLSGVIIAEFTTLHNCRRRGCAGYNISRPTGYNISSIVGTQDTISSGTSVRHVRAIFRLALLALVTL